MGEKLSKIKNKLVITGWSAIGAVDFCLNALPLKKNQYNLDILSLKNQYNKSKASKIKNPFLEAKIKVDQKKIKIPERYIDIFKEMMDEFSNFFAKYPDLLPCVAKVFDEHLYTDFKVVVDPDFLKEFGCVGCYKGRSASPEVVLLEYDSENRDYLKHCFTHEFVHFLIHCMYPNNEYVLWIEESFTERVACMINGDLECKKYLSSYRGLMQCQEIIDECLPCVNGVFFDISSFLHGNAYKFLKGYNLFNEEFNSIVQYVGKYERDIQKKVDYPETRFYDEIVKIKLGAISSPIDKMKVDDICWIADVFMYDKEYASPSREFFSKLYEHVTGRQCFFKIAFSELDECFRDVAMCHKNFIISECDAEKEYENQKLKESLQRFNSVVDALIKYAKRVDLYVTSYKAVPSSNKEMFELQLEIAKFLLLNKNFNLSFYAGKDTKSQQGTEDDESNKLDFLKHVVEPLENACSNEKTADFIMSNLYRLKNGQRVIICDEDNYDNPIVKIEKVNDCLELTILNFKCNKFDQHEIVDNVNEIIKLEIKQKKEQILKAEKNEDSASSSVFGYCINQTQEKELNT